MLAGASIDLGVGADVRLDGDDLVVLDQDVAVGRSPISGSMLRTVPPRMSVLSVICRCSFALAWFRCGLPQ